MTADAVRAAVGSVPGPDRAPDVRSEPDPPSPKPGVVPGFSLGRPIDRLDIACAAGMVAFVVLSYAVIPFTAYLLVHPLWHLVLTGSTSALITGGAYARVGRISMLAVIGTGVVGLAMFDPLFWLLGRRYGDQIARYLGKQLGMVRLVERAEAFVARFGLWAVVVAYYLPIPNLLIDVVVGASGVRMRRFLVADLVGTLLWLGMLVGLGYALGEPAVHTVKIISHYALYVTLGIFVLIGISVARMVRRMPKDGDEEGMTAD
jgi:membrane protein DedA with SNARE-associated domain